MAAMSPAAIESLAGEILASASLGPHAVFSLRADAGRDAFKARYRELARALHPDKARSRAAEEAFKVVTESFRAVAAANGAGGRRVRGRPDGRRAGQHQQGAVLARPGGGRRRGAAALVRRRRRAGEGTNARRAEVVRRSARARGRGSARARV